MKILLFYQYFGTPKGGWSTRVYEMTRRWVAAGHSVSIITSPYEKSDIRAGKFIERQYIEGIELIVINCADSNRYGTLKRVLYSIVFSLFSVYYALTEKCDVVLASSGPITVGLPALVAKFIRGKKMVFEVRDLWPDGAIELGKFNNSILRKIALSFEKLCYRNSSFVVPCSPGMEDGVKSKVNDVETLVVYNASDNVLFDSISDLPEGYDIYENKKIFLYAGSLGLMDEVEQVIEAMRYISDDAIHTLIIGDGAERKHLENLVAKYDLKNVTFMGLIPKTEVVKWFKVSYCTFVTFKDLPVLQTSSPNKMFDSFAAGVPIIQSTKGWIKELVEAEQCGVNVYPDNPKFFAEKIEGLVLDPSYRNQLANNAKRVATSTFDRSRLASIYLQKLLTLSK